MILLLVRQSILLILCELFLMNSQTQLPVVGNSHIVSDLPTSHVENVAMLSMKNKSSHKYSDELLRSFRIM